MQSFFQLDAKNLFQAHLLHPSFIKMCKAFYEEPIVNSKKVLKYIFPLLTLRLACFAHCFISISQEYWCGSHIGPWNYTDLPTKIYLHFVYLFFKFFTQNMFWVQYARFHTSYRPECLVDQSCEEFFLYVKTIKFFEDVFSIYYYLSVRKR